MSINFFVVVNFLFDVECWTESQLLPMLERVCCKWKPILIIICYFKTGTTSCDVTVQNSNDSSALLPDAYDYDSTLTPRIDDVTPARGGTGGGTWITIYGEGFE